jgi:predicted nucleic acid-binding protein
MPPLRIYLDTSVLGGLYDPEFEADTAKLLAEIRAGKAFPVLSEQVEIELEPAPQNVQALLGELYGLGAENIQLSVAADKLADAYLSAQVVSRTYRADALHIALATLANVDVLVSWNFKHIVNLRRIRGYNDVNLTLGYATMEIRSPKEVLENG